MKKLTKNFFLGFVVAAIGIAALSLIIKNHGIAKSIVQPELRVFTRYQIDPERLEPATYGEASEYDYITYLYSPLVQFDNQGQIVSGLSDKFFWDGTDLVFEIRKNAVTSKGDPITPQDVLFSIKRHHILLPDQASQLFSEVCDNQPVNKIDDPCPGLIAQGNKFIIRFKTRKPLYLDIFTNPDFLIVPSNAVDKNTLKVVDIFNTTGPYRILEANKKESYLRLEARKDHWLWKESIPQKVLIKTYFDKDGKEVSYSVMNDMFFAGEFDLIPTYAGARSTARKIVEEGLKDYSVFRSLPIATYIMFFSERAKAEYTSEERLLIGQIFRESFFKNVSSQKTPFSSSRTLEFFPPSSDGSLTDEQLHKYQSLLKSAEQVKLHRAPILHVVASYMQDIIEFIENTDGQLKYLNDETYTYPPNKDFHQRFDVFFSQVGASSIESADSIFWIKSMGWMPFSPEENDRWIQNYLETEDKKTRVAMMKELHFQMLINGMLAPIKSQDYAAVARKPWKLKFSKLFASTPLWQIEYEP